MKQRRVAEIIIETLIAAGVRRIYGVVGDSLNGLLEEILKRKDIDWIKVRHEETAGFAADAQADVTEAVTAAFQRDGPALVEEAGFNLWALKPVLNGRGDELVHLALSNLIR